MKVEEEEVPGAVDVSGKENKVMGRWIQGMWRRCLIQKGT